ncbi:MAG: hypothetical protein KAS19_10415 [Anaerolineales bacterium]|nr:hypothetical protein [Anaerolineales bacterium]
MWAWLLGPYISAIIRFEGKRGRTRTRKIIEGFEAHLLEAGLGTISEIFDGQRPHNPRGCTAQAWSVAEVLRSYVETFGNNQPFQNNCEEDRE